jgi:hypothetical protein
MSTNPFTNNPNYKQLFSIRDYNKCDNVEIVELYERKIVSPNTPKYALIRIVATAMNEPLKSIHKFDNLITMETTDDCGRISLVITTVYGSDNLIVTKFNCSCNRRSYITMVENEIYKYLL